MSKTFPSPWGQVRPLPATSSFPEHIVSAGQDMASCHITPPRDLQTRSSSYDRSVLFSSGKADASVCPFSIHWWSTQLYCPLDPEINNNREMAGNPAVRIPHHVSRVVFERSRKLFVAPRYGYKRLLFLLGSDPAWHQPVHQWSCADLCNVVNWLQHRKLFKNSCFHLFCLNMKLFPSSGKLPFLRFPSSSWRDQLIPHLPRY